MLYTVLYIYKKVRYDVCSIIILEKKCSLSIKSGLDDASVIFSVLMLNNNQWLLTGSTAPFYLLVYLV